MSVVIRKDHGQMLIESAQHSQAKDEPRCPEIALNRSEMSQNMPKVGNDSKAWDGDEMPSKQARND